MSKKVILTEAQFKEYMRSITKRLNENVGNERDLSVDEIIGLLHKMVESDFACYFKNGKQFICCGFGVGLSWGTIRFTSNNMIVSNLVEVDDNQADKKYVV
jgi:hypothetical protein